MKILILGNYEDKQTACYIMEACRNYASDIAGVDVRQIIRDLGMEKGQPVIVSEIKDLKITPNLIIVLKGVEITYDTLKTIKSIYPEAKVVNWLFDKYYLEKPVWETKEIFDSIKLYDIFFCSLKGVADKLIEQGLTNIQYLSEGCSLPHNNEVYMNSFQEGKYGEDISFCGNIGFLKQHPNRIPILEKIVKEGYRIKIWGEVVCEWKYIPEQVRPFCTKVPAINESHSMCVQSSLINLGIDQDPSLELSFSARLYRVLCAGGLYLTTYVKGMESVFKINKEGESVTGDEEVVVFYNYNKDLVTLLDFLLGNDEIRKKIAKNGKKIVLEKHTFAHRIKELLERIKEVENDK